MMVYTKSKFTGDAIFWSIFMIIPFASFIIFSYKILAGYTFNIKDNLLLLVFISLFCILLNFLKHIKHIVIKENKLQYYSILKPFGKTLKLNNYIGKLILEETGRGGSYKVVYLIDKQNRTAFKIMGLHYKNFDEINDALPLKTIKFNPNAAQYFKLLFSERLTIKNNNQKDNGILSSILRVFKLLTIVGVILLIILITGKIINNIW